MLLSAHYQTQLMGAVLALCYTGLTFGILIATVAYRLHMKVQLPALSFNLS